MVESSDTMDMKEFQLHEKDTGSADVQVARLTSRIGSSGVGGSGVQDIRGEVWDVGRMRQDDPKLTGRDLRPYVGDDPAATWPQ
jgi:hypothetical protein